MSKKSDIQSDPKIDTSTNFVCLKNESKLPTVCCICNLFILFGENGILIIYIIYILYIIYYIYIYIYSIDVSCVQAFVGEVSTCFSIGKSWGNYFSSHHLLVACHCLFSNTEM